MLVYQRVYIYIYTFNHFKNYGFRYRFSHQSNGYPILNRRDPGIDDFITPSAPGSEAEPISCAEKGWCNLVMPLRKAVERWFPIGHIISYIHIYIIYSIYSVCIYIHNLQYHSTWALLSVAMFDFWCIMMQHPWYRDLPQKLQGGALELPY